VSRFGAIVCDMDALTNVAVWEKLFALTSPRPGASKVGTAAAAGPAA